MAIAILSLAACTKKDSAPAPTLSITSISPKSGVANTLDTIKGVGFSPFLSEDSVYFNGTIATILNAKADQLIVLIPAGGISGNVSVTVHHQTATGPTFTYTTNNGGTGTNPGSADPKDSVYTVSTLCGTRGFADGTGLAAKFNTPTAMVMGTDGNLYVNDYGNNRIRKVTPDGVVTTFAGSATIGYGDGLGTAASFFDPQGIAVDPSGNFFVTDYGNNKIRKITPAGAVSSFAGGARGYVEGTGSAAQFHSPINITGDRQGNLYVFDMYNNRIRKITSGAVVSTLTGSGVQGTADGTGTAAQIGSIGGMCSDPANNIYMTDQLYGTVRKITPAGVVTTIAGVADPDHPMDLDGVGTKAKFGGPMGIIMDQYGNLIVGDGAGTIRKITPAGVVTTIAGIAGTQGSDDGPAHQATFWGPIAIVVTPSGIIYVLDCLNNNIRVLTPKRT
ncbi:MAG TPA: IPT/TIG domain-containing protein [Puia sp.]